MSLKQIVLIFAIISSLASGYNVERARNRRALDVKLPPPRPSEPEVDDEKEEVELIQKPANYSEIIKHELENEKIEEEVTEEFEDTSKGRGATNIKEKHWNYKMTIVIDIAFSDAAREKIQSAIYTLSEAMKCFDFFVLLKGSKVSSRKDHLVIQKEKEKLCYSLLGRQKGQQVTALGEGCNLYGTTMHEIMHVLGFYHEHVRPDRDQYVIVNWNTLTKDTQKGQYNIRKDQTTFSPVYDFESIMHYPIGPSLQAKPGKIPSGVHPGQRTHLSKQDVIRLQGLYPCSKKPA